MKSIIGWALLFFTIPVFADDLKGKIATQQDIQIQQMYAANQALIIENEMLKQKIAEVYQAYLKASAVPSICPGRFEQSPVDVNGEKR